MALGRMLLLAARLALEGRIVHVLRLLVGVTIPPVFRALLLLFGGLGGLSGGGIRGIPATAGLRLALALAAARPTRLLRLSAGPILALVRTLRTLALLRQARRIIFAALALA